MILLIDNYDSFTWNLVQRLGEIDPRLPMEVVRNDAITLDEVTAKNPSHIIISSGPCTPNEAGISHIKIERFAAHLPILGVCLGHQCIGSVFGGNVQRNWRVMHGKTSQKADGRVALVRSRRARALTPLRGVAGRLGGRMPPHDGSRRSVGR